MPQPAAAAPMQRNALAPGLLAAIALFVSPLFVDGLGATIIRFVVAILACIVAWFAVQARQWWWTVVFVAVAVLWNPIFPIALDPVVWTVGGVVAALLFIVAGALIRTPREE